MSEWDAAIALLAWLASFVAAFVATLLWPFDVVAVIGAVGIIAATFNVWHQRSTLYHVGDEFERRVRTTLANEIIGWEARIKKMERGVDDVKSAQNTMATSLKGPRFGA